MAAASGRILIAPEVGALTGNASDGQARHHYGLRVRLYIWPPLRLIRLRHERESLGVVLPSWLLTSKEVWKRCGRLDSTFTSVLPRRRFWSRAGRCSGGEFARRQRSSARSSTSWARSRGHGHARAR